MAYKLQVTHRSLVACGFVIVHLFLRVYSGNGGLAYTRLHEARRGNVQLNYVRVTERP